MMSLTGEKKNRLDDCKGIYMHRIMYVDLTILFF